jgi:hypothetical protein
LTEVLGRGLLLDWAQGDSAVLFAGASKLCILWAACVMSVGCMCHGSAVLFAGNSIQCSVCLLETAFNPFKQTCSVGWKQHAVQSA